VCILCVSKRHLQFVVLAIKKDIINNTSCGSEGVLVGPRSQLGKPVSNKHNTQEKGSLQKEQPHIFIETGSERGSGRFRFRDRDSGWTGLLGGVWNLLEFGFWLCFGFWCWTGLNKTKEQNGKHVIQTRRGDNWDGHKRNTIVEDCQVARITEISTAIC